jgi:hypothetical protein
MQSDKYKKRSDHNVAENSGANSELDVKWQDGNKEEI